MPIHLHYVYRYFPDKTLEIEELERYESALNFFLQKFVFLSWAFFFIEALREVQE